MVRRIANQVHKQASRLMRGEYLKTQPAWYQAVLDHPPLPLPPKASPTRRTQDGAEDLPSTQSTSSSKRLKAERARPMPIHYIEDEIRRQFFRDHPFEAFRPVSLNEGAEIEKEHPVRGVTWTRLIQRGRNPRPEDCVKFVLNLHQHHGLPLNKAYPVAVAQYRALRSEHHISTQVAAMEAESHGAQFGQTETELGFEKEEKAIETWTKSETQDPGALAARKRWRAIVERNGPIGEFTRGREYVRLWKAGVRPSYTPTVATPDLDSIGLLSGGDGGTQDSADFLGLIVNQATKR